MNEEEKTELIPATTKTETALDIGAVVASLAPWIGGPVSYVLGGMAVGRKINRVRGVLEGVAKDLQDFQAEVSKEYVKTEDFQDLLERTLQQVADEGNEEKRRVYRDFLVGAIKSPGEPYNEQRRILRVLEDIQPDHIRVLKALNEDPDPNPGMIGSPMGTLTKRLPNMSRDLIADLISQLNDMRVTNLQHPTTNMTGRGAQGLQHTITPLGR